MNINKEKFGIEFRKWMKEYYSDEHERVYRSSEAEDIAIRFAQCMAEKIVSLPPVSDSHFTEFCCYLTGHNESTISQMYEDWNRSR